MSLEIKPTHTAPFFSIYTRKFLAALRAFVIHSPRDARERKHHEDSVYTYLIVSLFCGEREGGKESSDDLSRGDNSGELFMTAVLESEPYRARYITILVFAVWCQPHGVWKIISAAFFVARVPATVKFFSVKVT